MVRTSDRIAGGFVLVKVASLMATWRACRARPLGIGDFRAWLACRELVARRCGIEQGREPAYGFAELAGLLGVSEKRVRASIGRLVVADLLEWSGSAIAFPDPPGDPAGLEDSIGRGRGSVAIPRRLVRLLAGGARPALVATSLGILLRCLSRRRGGFDGRGRVKAGWVARAFRVDVRRVKQARLELVALGWIEPEPSDQCAENRWGRAYRIDLAWDRVRPGGRSLPPLPRPGRPAIATPSSDLEPLPEREENQEPLAAEARTGVEIRGTGGADKALPAANLDDVQSEDLEGTVRLLDLHRQAVERGLVTPSEADRLRFVAAAEHALAVGKANPPGLFASLVRNRCWRYITGADEDRANARLKALERNPKPSRVAGPPAPSPGPCRMSSFVPCVPRPGGPSSLSSLLDRVATVRHVRDLDLIGAGVRAISGASSPEPVAEKPTRLDWRDYVPEELGGRSPVVRDGSMGT